MGFTFHHQFIGAHIKMTILSELDQIIQNGQNDCQNKNSNAGVEIHPNPEFVIKTTYEVDEKIKIKVFINICSHLDIHEPSIKTTIQDDGEKVEGLNVPVSISEKQNFLYKDVLCLVFAMVVNPIVIQDMKEDISGNARHFLCQFAIQSILSRHKIALSAKFKVLKEVYIGELMSHFIRPKIQIPKIEIMSESAPSSSSSNISIRSEASKVKISQKVAEILPTCITLIEGKIEAYFCSSADNSKKETFLAVNHEYVEPTMEVDAIYDEIYISCFLENNDPALLLSNFSINMSAFRLQVSFGTTKILDIFYPCAVIPTTANCTLSEVVGYLNVYRLSVVVSKDSDTSQSRPDPGSRLGLIADAFAVDSTSTNNSKHTIISPQSTKVQGSVPKNSVIIDDGEALPEDLFHSKDATSSFILNQRDQAYTEKRSDQASRNGNDNDNESHDVEYVDVDEIRRSLQDQSSSLSSRLDICPSTKTEFSESLVDTQFFSEVWGQLLE